MRKRRLLFCLAILFFPIIVKAENVEYTLYDSTIMVNENRTLDVAENYKVYFTENTDKTIRSIDLNPSIIRPNKSKLYTSSRIENISSSIEMQSKNKNGKKLLMFDVDGIQDSVKDYSIEYKYNLGKDELKGKDELYYDIVNNLDAPISNFTFRVVFPTSVEDYKVYFAIDGQYNLSEDDISYYINGNEITGTLNILLSNNQSVSIYVELPDGYFKGASDNFNYVNYLYILIPLIGFIITYLLYSKYGKGISLKIRRNSSVYNNFDSAEIGYLYKGVMEEKDLTSLVIYLATKGYLKIVEHDDGYKLGKENTFHFEKTVDYDKNNAAQELIFNELFRDRDKAELKDIEYHFSETFKEARSMLGNEDNYKRLFFIGISKIKLILGVILALILGVVNYRSMYLLTNTHYLVIPLVLLIMIGLYYLFVAKVSLTIKGIVCAILIGISIYTGIMPVLYQKHYLIIYVIELIITVIMAYLFSKLSDRTKYGVDALSDIYGLKYYLDTITPSELENEIKDNPNYYFDMVPYACVLGDLETWIQKGKDIVTNPPEWYIPAGEFNLNNFEKFLNNVLYTTSLVMMKQNYLSELVAYQEKNAKETSITPSDNSEEVKEETSNVKVDESNNEEIEEIIGE